MCAARGLARAVGAPPRLRRGRCRRCRGRGRRSAGSSFAFRGRSRSRCSPARRRGSPSRSARRSTNLLLPLYVVVAGAAVALAVELLAPAWVAHVRAGRMFTPRGRHTRRGAAARGAARPRAPRARDLRLAGSAPRSGGRGSPCSGRRTSHQGAVYLLFYMLPLGLIAAAMARLPWRLGWVKVLYAQLAAMAVVFALIGIWQYLDADIYWNPKVKVDNVYAPGRLVLPRQLGLLRPVDLRALPRRRDPRERRARPLRARAAGRGSRRASRP